MIRLSLCLGFALSLLAAAPSGAQPAHPKTAKLSVVELFTSQGCSSCPPANANFAAFADRPDVIALSFGVTYWDQLGWKDTFAQPAFTDRQFAYARSLHHAGPFTPQVVVDGQVDGVGAQHGDIEALIAQANLSGPKLIVSNGAAEISDWGAPKGGADVWLVFYDPRTIQVPIRAGENTGRTLPHRNVVRALVHLGEWQGPAARFVLPAGSPGLRSVILVQARNAGLILAAAQA